MASVSPESRVDVVSLRSVSGSTLHVRKDSVNQSMASQDSCNTRAGLSTNNNTNECKRNTPHGLMSESEGTNYNRNIRTDSVGKDIENTFTNNIKRDSVSDIFGQKYSDNASNLENAGTTKRDSLSHALVQEYHIRRKSEDQTLRRANWEYIGCISDSEKPEETYFRKTVSNSVDTENTQKATGEQLKEQNYKKDEYVNISSPTDRTHRSESALFLDSNIEFSSSHNVLINTTEVGQEEGAIDRTNSQSFLLKDMHPTGATTAYTGNSVLTKRSTMKQGSTSAATVHSGRDIPTIVVDSSYGSMESGESSSDDSMKPVQRNRKKPRECSTAKSRREPALYENKALKLSVAVIGTFMFCFAPFEVTFVVERICPTCVGDIAWMTVNTLAFLSAAVNPFVYCLYSTEFRKAMKNLLCVCRKRDDLI